MFVCAVFGPANTANQGDAEGVGGRGLLKCYTQHSSNTVFRCMDGPSKRQVAFKAGGHHMLQTGKGRSTLSVRCTAMAAVREAAVVAAMRVHQVGRHCVVQPWRAQGAVRGASEGNLVVCSVGQAGHVGAIGSCMEWVPGRPVQTDRRNVMVGLSVRSRLEFLLSALEGCAALHTRGLAHRDIKLDNVLLVRGGLTGAARAVFVDFAGAHTLGRPVGEHSATESRSGRRSAETLAGEIEKQWASMLQHVPIEAMVEPEHCAHCGQDNCACAKAAEAPAYASRRSLQIQGKVVPAQAATSAATQARCSHPPTVPARRQMSVHTACEELGIPGLQGTRFWRASNDDHQNAFGMDCSSMAALAVCMAMGEVVMKRAEMWYAQTDTAKAEMPVMRWLTRCPGAQQVHSHRLAAEACSGLAWGWCRRLEQGGWEKGTDSAAMLPEAPAGSSMAAERWHRHSLTGQSIVTLLCCADDDLQLCCQKVVATLKRGFGMS